MSLDVLLDSVGNIGEAIAGAGIGDTDLECFATNAEELLRLWGNPSDWDSDGGITVVTAVASSNVDTDNIAFLEDTRTGDAVDDLFVD